MKVQPFFLHARSPLHAGTGQAVDVIDLPIARMRSTGIPIVPGSTIKGVLRDGVPDLNGEERRAIFGPDPEHENASDHAGALVVGDARLHVLPVRSFSGTFAWVSSPLLLELARRDLEGLADLPPAISEFSGPLAKVGALTGEDSSLNVFQAKVYLEDLDLAVAGDPTVAAWASWLADRIAAPWLRRRMVVVDDETMSFLWETATQVDTRVRLNPDTRTVADRQLWTEESLPPETLLVGIFAADKSRRKNVELDPDTVLRKAASGVRPLQFGGKATVGRGRCRLVPLGVIA